jgi:hypothetical protein
MKFHSSFAPTCPEGDGDHAPEQAATLGAGVQWFEAYAFAEENGITLVGGEKIILCFGYCLSVPRLGSSSCISPGVHGPG